MKYETGEVFTKAMCFVLIGFFTPLTTSLAQWANSGEQPSKIVWIIILATCMVGSATQLLSFLSGSYADYLTKKNRNGKNGSVTTPVSTQVDTTQKP